MPEPATKIHIASNLLRSPHLFDGLGPPDKPGEGGTRVGRKKYGACTGGICRDLVLFAAWHNQAKTELRLPDFCRMMGYDSSNLTRSCTPEEVEEIRRTGWPEEHVEAFSNVLGLALVRLVTHNFIFPDKGKSSKHERIAGSKIVEHIDLFEPKSTGTLLTFTLSTEILEQNRKVFQTPVLEEYLSLRTEGKNRKPGHPGHPDDAARRMYLRLTWKRQYWDWLIKEHRFEEAEKFRADSYFELVQVAGLADRAKYWPEKRIAAELRKLLNRVGGMSSIRLEPNVSMVYGKYTVTWTHKPFLDATKVTPTREKYPVGPARADWGTAPAPGEAPTPRVDKPKRTKLAASTPGGAKKQPIKAAPAKAPKATPQVDRTKLINELNDRTNSLRWLESTEAKTVRTYANNEALLEQHQQEARAAIQSIQQQLKRA